jgi:hypothetical protein
VDRKFERQRGQLRIHHSIDNRYQASGCSAAVLLLAP